MVEMKFRLPNGNAVFVFFFFVGPETIGRHGVGSKRKGPFSRRRARTDAAATVYDRYYVIDARNGVLAALFVSTARRIHRIPSCSGTSTR